VQAASRGQSLVELRDRLLGIGGALPSRAAPAGSALAAAGAALGVRAIDGVRTARLAGEQPEAKPLDAPDSGLTGVLRDVAEVVPAWVWIALAALSALVLALGANTILAAARTRRLERQRAKLMDDVGALQAALLPVVPPHLGEQAMSVAYRPADGLAAGGDFYDVFALPDGRVGLLLGDVSGHGRDALAKTALVRFTVRAHLEAGMSPREAIAIAGRSLDGRLGDDFATVIAAIHDPVRGTLTYSNAGHPPPLVLGPSAHEPLIASSAPPIDLGFPTGHRQTVLPMPEGSIVALYSDGLIEARVDGALIGVDRLAAWLDELGPDATAQQLVDLVVQRADGVRDDLAAVILHATDGATAPLFRSEQLKLDVLDTDGPDLDVFLRAGGIGRAERRLVGRWASEQLSVAGGAIVEILATQPPRADVTPIGGRARAPLTVESPSIDRRLSRSC
jgi:serine phosphatase RsbU (regulator of sigma subunit)